jgi:hypothetical protein
VPNKFVSRSSTIFAARLFVERAGDIKQHIQIVVPCIAEAGLEQGGYTPQSCSDE